MRLAVDSSSWDSVCSIEEEIIVLKDFFTSLNLDFRLWFECLEFLPMSDKLINQLPNQNLTQADADTQAGVYRKSPITALMQQCSSGRRHSVTLNLPDNSIIPLWVRKPGNNTIKRLSSASNYQLIMDYYDRKVVDEGHETDFVPAFPASDEPQLRQLSSAVIKELVDVILEL